MVDADRPVPYFPTGAWSMPIAVSFTFRPAPAYSSLPLRAVSGQPMDTTAPPLEDLRAEIDRIDQALLRLLIERAAVVREQEALNQYTPFKHGD